MTLGCPQARRKVDRVFYSASTSFVRCLIIGLTTNAPLFHLRMSSADYEERPAKKRRFFVDDSPIADRTLHHEPSLPDEVDALPETFPDCKPVDSINPMKEDERNDHAEDSG